MLVFGECNGCVLPPPPTPSPPPPPRTDRAVVSKEPHGELDPPSAVKPSPVMSLPESDLGATCERERSHVPKRERWGGREGAT